MAWIYTFSRAQHYDNTDFIDGSELCGSANLIHLIDREMDSASLQAVNCEQHRNGVPALSPICTHRISILLTYLQILAALASRKRI